MPATENTNSFTYLIAQVLKCKGNQFTLRHSCHAEVEPCAIVLAIHVGAGIACDPNVKVVLLIAALGLRHVSTAELAAEDDFGLGDFPARPLWKAL